MGLRTIFFCGASVLLFACGVDRKEKDGVVRVKTAEAVSTVGDVVWTYPGRVEAAEEACVAFRVSGVVSDIYVDEGSRVREGDVLARLDATDYEVQLAATEAEYTQAKNDAERIAALYAEGGTTPSVADKAKYGLLQLEAKLKHHRDELGYTVIRAPFSGSVAGRMCEPHEAVAAGMPVVRVVGDEKVEVGISLPACDYVQRGRFDSFSCVFDVLGGTEYELRPKYIAPCSNANQVYPMQLSIVPKAGAPLPSPGMNTTVRVKLKVEDDGCVFVPSTSLTEVSGCTGVYVFDAGRVFFRQVSVDRVCLDGMAVVRGSLVAGERVVCAGVHRICDGQEVEVAERMSLTNVGGLL